MWFSPAFFLAGWAPWLTAHGTSNFYVNGVFWLAVPGLNHPDTGDAWTQLTTVRRDACQTHALPSTKMNSEFFLGWGERMKATQRANQAREDTLRLDRTTLECDAETVMMRLQFVRDLVNTSAPHTFGFTP